MKSCSLARSQLKNITVIMEVINTLFYHEDCELRLPCFVNSFNFKVFFYF